MSGPAVAKSKGEGMSRRGVDCVTAGRSMGVVEHATEIGDGEEGSARWWGSSLVVVSAPPSGRVPGTEAPGGGAWSVLLVGSSLEVGPSEARSMTVDFLFARSAGGCLHGFFPGDGRWAPSSLPSCLGRLEPPGFGERPTFFAALVGKAIAENPEKMTLKIFPSQKGDPPIGVLSPCQSLFRQKLQRRRSVPGTRFLFHGPDPARSCAQKCSKIF